MKNKIYFIDYSASGNYGLYIDKIKNTLNDVDFTYIVPFDYKYNSINTWKIFNFFSNKIKHSIAQKIVKFFEMYFIYLSIFTKLIIEFRTRKIIIISLYQPFKAVYFFLKLIRFTNSKLLIIVHDLVAFPSTYPSFIFADQNEILKLADGLIAHNEHSKIELLRLKKDLFVFRFPLLDEENSKVEKKYFSTKSKIKFLLLGHLRYEKGADILIEAWKKFILIYPDCELIIAGSLVPGCNISIENISSVKLISHYLNDDEYSDLIFNCDYGILPYRFGTNSGILSSFVAAGKPVINSNLSLFTDSPFTLRELTFKIEDNFDGLLNILCFVTDNSILKYEKFCNHIKLTKREYERLFKNELVKSVEEIKKIYFLN